MTRSPLDVFIVRLAIAVILSSTSLPARCADRSLQENPALAKYFEQQVAKIEQENALQKYTTLEDWTDARQILREQLFDMLGLAPMPERTPLHPTITGSTQEQDFQVEKLHFQSLPGLYVTANLYLPKEVSKPLPVVLYVCGHARVKEGDISFGNKVGYQHHGAWYARNGYACLTIDTLQLGEIEGIHHGTYSHNRWWWNAHGFTPAGVEAWNCIRALDYLETRSEVDIKRIGVTGRSGGGAYSWWIAALDDRIQCAVPVAGITTLRNHIVDGCVEGHCDCMYMTNRHRWDYATVAALVAPRPLLISNSDKDSIFPLDGVVEIHRQVRHIYELYGKSSNLGLQITEGPHKDTQELRVHAFRWMNRWLKNDESLIEKTATKFFEPQQLRVFAAPVDDQRNTSIDEAFVKLAQIPNAANQQRILSNQEVWRENAIRMLSKTCFAAWPYESPSVKESKTETVDLRPGAKMRCNRIHFRSENHVPLFVDLFQRNAADTSDRNHQLIHLILPEHNDWTEYSDSIQQGTPSNVLKNIDNAFAEGASTVAVFFPRGSGPHAWAGDARKQTQIRRRFQLLGTTLDAMRVWDIRSAISALQQTLHGQLPVSIEASGTEAWHGLLTMIVDSSVSSGRFAQLTDDPNQMAVFPDIARIFTAQELIAIALSKGTLEFIDSMPNAYDLAKDLSTNPLWTGGSLKIH